jgi:hypothetical protein
VTRPVFLFVLVVSLVVSFSAAAETSRPLRQSELLALVAGNALPENIVNEIRTRGIAFRLDGSFRNFNGLLSSCQRSLARAGTKE